MCHWIYNVNKEIAIMKRYQIEILALKIIITEIKNWLEGLSNRFEKEEERIKRQEVRYIEITQSEKQEKELKKVNRA